MAVAAAAQAPAPTEAPPHAPSPKLAARTTADLAAMPKELATHAHAFAGSITLHIPTTEQHGRCDYTGARYGDLRVLRCEPWTVLTRGERQLQRKDGDDWTPPQGNAPDCPLGLDSLAACLADAKLRSVRPDTFEDRPAMALHLEWDDAKDTEPLLAEMTIPDNELQRAIEALSRVLRRLPHERWVVDAAVHYDPATQQLLAATLRLAILSPNDRPADVEPPPPPSGLPALPRDTSLELLVELARRPADALPMPTLTEAQRTRLGLSAAAPPPAPGTNSR